MGVKSSRSYTKPLRLFETVRCPERKQRSCLSSPREAYLAWPVGRKKNGLAATLHQNKGKTPVNKTTGNIVVQILELLKNRYYDFSLAHAHEKIRGEHHIKISYRTLVKLAHTGSTASCQNAPSAQARLRRERFANEGMLLQMDGSHHKWNGKDEWCMIVLSTMLRVSWCMQI